MLVNGMWIVLGGKEFLAALSARPITLEEAVAGAWYAVKEAR